MAEPTETTSAAMAPPVHRKRTSCRACGSGRLRMFLALGPTPLANSFLRTPEEFAAEASYPLDVYFCESCTLVQLLDVIDPETLFRNYIYVTGTSDTMAAHNEQYAAAVVDLLKLDAEALVIEVASNDGSLLKQFRPHGVKVMGIEPARNIAAMARADGIPTVEEFFSSSTASALRRSHGPANAVIANNVLAHVDDTVDFLRGCRNLLAERGMVVIEAPYLGELLDRLEYDTIYHEHLCYFSASALMRLCEQSDLSVVRFERVAVHGGSLRMYAGARSDYTAHSADALDLVRQEDDRGVTSPARLERFAADVRESRRALVALIRELKSGGRTLAAYGAPAKGNTLLNYCSIGADLIPYTVDKNPMKVGLYTPGMHIPVRPAATLLESQPDYTLILAWNFAAEIMRQQTEYRSRGGRFIVPLPEPKVV